MAKCTRSSFFTESNFQAFLTLSAENFYCAPTPHPKNNILMEEIFYVFDMSSAFFVKKNLDLNGTKTIKFCFSQMP